MTGLAILLILIVGLILFIVLPDEMDDDQWAAFNEEMAYRTGSEWPEGEEDL